MNKLKNLPTPAKYLIGFIISFALLMGGCEWKLNADLGAAKVRARKAGVALTLDDLKALIPHPSDDQNAAPVINRMISLNNGQDLASKEVFNFLNKKSLTAAEWAHFKSIRPQMDEISLLASELENKTSVDFKRKWEMGFDVTFPEFSGMRACVKFICAKARLLAHEGKRIEALQELKKAFHLSQFAGEEPTLIAMLVQVVCESTCYSALQLVLGEEPLTPTDRQIISEIRDLLKTPKQYGYYFQSEPAGVSVAAEQVKMAPFIGETSPSDPTVSAISLLMKTNYRKAVQAEYLNSMAKIVQIGLDKSISLKDLNLKAEDFDRSVQTYDKYDLKKRIASIFFTVFAQASKAYTKLFVYRTMLDLLLGKDATIDPFTDGPLLKTPFQNGTLYYSVGPNLKDDKGITYDANGKRVSGSDDISMYIHK